MITASSSGGYCNRHQNVKSVQDSFIGSQYMQTQQYNRASVASSSSYSSTSLYKHVCSVNKQPVVHPINQSRHRKFGITVPPTRYPSKYVVSKPHFNSCVQSSSSLQMSSSVRNDISDRKHILNRWPSDGYLTEKKKVDLNDNTDRKTTCGAKVCLSSSHSYSTEPKFILRDRLKHAQSMLEFDFDDRPCHSVENKKCCKNNKDVWDEPNNLNSKLRTSSWSDLSAHRRLYRPWFDTHSVRLIILCACVYYIHRSGC